MKRGKLDGVKKWGLRQQIRMSKEDAIFVMLKGNGESFNASLNAVVDFVREIEAEALGEIRGYLQPNEWKFLANALKDDIQAIVSKNELVRRIMKIQMMEALSSYYQVKPAELAAKIQGLNCCHVLALTQRIHEYWTFGVNNGVDINEWAQY